MKVYVAFQGEYSDRGCLGVFSTREAAEAIGVGAPDAFDVQEFELDELVGASYGPTWTASIDLRTGEVTQPSRAYPRLRLPGGRCEFEPEDYLDTDLYFLWVHSPISQEHAVKVAIEKRQEWFRARSTVGS